MCEFFPSCCNIRHVPPRTAPPTATRPVSVSVAATAAIYPISFPVQNCTHDTGSASMAYGFVLTWQSLKAQGISWKLKNKQQQKSQDQLRYLQLFSMKSLSLPGVLRVHPQYLFFCKIGFQSKDCFAVFENLTAIIVHKCKFLQEYYITLLL